MSAARFELRRSPSLAAAIVAAHAAAAAGAYMVVPGMMGAALAIALLALGAAVAWSRALLRPSGAVRAMEIGVAGTFVFSWTDEWFTGGSQISDWGVRDAEGDSPHAYLFPA